MHCKKIHFLYSLNCKSINSTLVGLVFVRAEMISRAID